MTSSPSPPTVVVVDDNADHVFLIMRLLRTAVRIGRLELFTGSNAARSFLLGCVAKAAESPALCFLDVRMPGDDGLDLLKWIRSHSQFDTMVIVMLSGSEDPKEIDRARNAGAQCYWIKYPPPDVIREVFAQAADNPSALPSVLAAASKYNLLRLHP